MIELGISPVNVIHNARKAFERELTYPDTYTTFRGLRSRSLNMSNGVPHELEGYLDTLPTFKGLSFEQLVEAEITARENKARSQNVPFEPITVVDIGYGNGQFLLDCQKEWGNKVRLVGLGTDVYSKMDQKKSFGTTGVHIIRATHQDLIDRSIELINGNVIDIRKIFGDNYADFIVSSLALQYVNYPPWELFKKIYRTLKPGGIALLEYYSQLCHHLKVAQKYLNDHKYEFEIGTESVAFKKTESDIALPIRTVGWIGDLRLSIEGKLALSTQ